MKQTQPNQITAFWHCRRCIAELPEGVAPSEFQRIQVGWTQDGLQAWCNRHNIPVVTLGIGKSIEACKKFIELHDDIFKAKQLDVTSLEKFGQDVFETKLIECLNAAKEAIDEEGNEEPRRS